MKQRALTPDEIRAWARVAATVKPIGPRAADLEEMSDALEQAASEPAPAAAPPPSRQKERSSQKSLPPPAERGGEKKVRRGQLLLAATFDLHGHTQASAARALPDFLEAQQSAGARCVLVITGKGKQGQGVLRRNFLHWLESPPARRLVSGYAESHPRHGGAGAFYVFLRRTD